MIDNTDDDPEKVSREEAKRLLDDAAAGTLTVCTLEPIPTLGRVKPGSLAMEPTVTSYRFGSVDNFDANIPDPERDPEE